MKSKYFSAVLFLFLFSASQVFADHSGTITYQINITVQKDSKNAKLWIPYPVSDEFQKISNVQIKGNYSESAVYRDPGSEALFYYAGWKNISAEPSVTMSFDADIKDRRRENIKGSDLPVPEPIKKYLQPSEWVPSDNEEIKAIAAKATAGKNGILEKAMGVYDWVVENTFRDPAVKGCGFGVPLDTLNKDKGGGKCADISSVYVVIARAAGVPARDVFGLRMEAPKDGDITSAFHCWSEFYLPGTGWVIADPADVRKMMLVHNVELKDADKWKKFFWGGDDLFRLVLEKNSRGVVFEPAQEGAPLNYFMYPYAQVDGKSLDFFDAKNFSYSVEYKSR